MMRTPFLLIIAFILACAPASGQNPSLDSPKSNIDAFLQDLHKDGLFNGCILVAKDGQVIYKDAFGYADFKNKRNLELSTPFYLASVSKQFTTMAIMMLEAKGMLSFDDVLSSYFPKFPAYATKATIRQMMQHTSGIANHYALGIYRPGLTNHDVLLALINQADPDFEPGTKYNYSNGAYVLLAMIVEKVSGVSFAEFCSKHIFTPLQMKDTWVADEKEPARPNRAVGHTPFGILDDYEIYTTGAGGIYSTVEDLLKWDRALSNGKLVGQIAMERAYQKAILSDGSLIPYGFGWSILEANGVKVVSHGGSLNGFRTRIVRNLENGTLVVLLTNKTNLLTAEIAEGIGSILADKEPKRLKKEDQYAHYVRDPDVLVSVLYAVISGEAGQARDWNLFRYLFSSDSKLIPVRKSGDGQLEAVWMSPEDYISRSGRWLEENGFFEREIHSTSELYGPVMHRFSTYESYRSGSDAQPFARGINSIQLHFDGDRWWVLNIFWNSETDEFPIPGRYLPK